MLRATLKEVDPTSRLQKGRVMLRAAHRGERSALGAWAGLARGPGCGRHLGRLRFSRLLLVCRVHGGSVVVLLCCRSAQPRCGGGLLPSVATGRVPSRMGRGSLAACL